MEDAYISGNNTWDYVLVGSKGNICSKRALHILQEYKQSILFSPEMGPGGYLNKSAKAHPFPYLLYHLNSEAAQDKTNLINTWFHSSFMILPWIHSMTIPSGPQQKISWNLILMFSETKSNSFLKVWNIYNINSIYNICNIIYNIYYNIFIIIDLFLKQ